MRKEGLVMKRRALSTLMALSLFCAGGAAMADGAYTPGTYTVSADGNNGAITLRVEMTAVRLRISKSCHRAKRQAWVMLPSTR